MKKENAYFAELDRIARDFEQRHEAHKKLKQQIIDTKGWDSEELKAWYEEDKAAAFPYTSGEMKAYWAFKNSLELDELEMSDSCWDNEWHDFVETLRKMGIAHFTVTTNSSGLMDDLFGYQNEGCTMLGLHTIDKCENRWGRDETKKVKGILFEIN